ncbi:MAG: hypothetical protein F9K40_16685 [Kofleriaceae bacterium]|nr:MAG: hypothetical protein F9K40_16685 [Kofleriaceae bacterium]
MRRARKEPVQLQLELRKVGRGGVRPGAGRKKKPGAIRHDRRPEVSRSRPVHVSLRADRAVGRLRRRDAYRALRGAVATCLGRSDFRIVHMSIQANHVHLLVEAEHKRGLANGVRAFMISATRRLNALRGRRGKVFTERYHAVRIGSRLQARRALAYVINNWRRHREDLDGRAQRRANVDPYSTGILFDGWKVPGYPAPYRFAIPPDYEPLPVCAPTCWLFTVGWRDHGWIDVRERPGPITHGRARA